MNLVVSGRLNKQVAAELGASETTVKIHRSHVMEKIGQILPEFVRMADKLRSDKLLSLPASPSTYRFSRVRI